MQFKNHYTWNLSEKPHCVGEGLDINHSIFHFPLAQNSDQGFVPQPTFNITPGNVEFFMEVGPGSITIDSLEATVVTNGNSGGTSGGIVTNG